MIVLKLCEEKDKITGKKRIIVSHGIDTSTYNHITLPPEPPERMGYFNKNICEWILKD